MVPTVIIDGSGSKDLRKQLKRYFKRCHNTPEQRFIMKIKTQDSTKNNLLQTADMIVGAIHRSYGDKNDANQYRKIVSYMEMRVQLWPR